MNLMDFCLEEEFTFKDSFLEFLGSRLLTARLKEELKKKECDLKGAFFRGMPYPKHLLKVGNVIEEWHGACHFSKAEKVAQDFAIISRNGYINEDYYEQLQEELNCEEVEFIQLIMTTDNLTGVEIYKILDELDIDRYKGEQEITTFDKNFIIKSVEKRIVDGEELYYAKVDMV